MESEQQRVRELARTAAYHSGAAMRYEDVARWLPSSWSPSFIARECELAGFPVWTSCPDEALRGL